jgi:hypothetical protein
MITDSGSRTHLSRSSTVLGEYKCSRMWLNITQSNLPKGQKSKSFSSAQITCDNREAASLASSSEYVIPATYRWEF